VTRAGRPGTPLVVPISMQHQNHPHELVPLPVHQDSTAALLPSVTDNKETAVTFLAEDLARARWSEDLATARTARLAGAIRRRRALERSQDRARRLVRLASLAAQRSESVAGAGALSAAR
jgi:hypothetical protein